MDELIPRCGALTVDGTPCERPPMKGQKRCHRHGGASPQSRAAAQRHLALAADWAIKRLADVLEDPKAAPADVIRAAVAVLDRAGYSPSLVVKHAMTASNDEDEWLWFLNAEELQQIDDLYSQMRVVAEERMGLPLLPTITVKALPVSNDEAEEAVLVPVKDEPDEE